MHSKRLARSLRSGALALCSIILASCGTGSGEDSVDAPEEDVAAAKMELVFADYFGDPPPASAGKTAARSIPIAPLVPGNWVVDTGYGENGWGNDEWQRYDNSMDNLFTENGNLVIRARCPTAPACGKRDGTITSAKVTSKNRINIQYGTIKARIKMPSGAGMWPAFWTLGSDIDKRPWPDAGEIDIVEMHYFYSDTRTTHFSTHWAGPRYTSKNRPICASGVAAIDAAEEENCKTVSKTFEAKDGFAPLTDDFHVYELEWNQNTIVGKIDGITYFTQAIDGSTMEEFLKDHYLILNVAVGGTLGGPSGPSMSAADWADPNQTDMLVDWVEVYERVPAIAGTLIEESGGNLPYNRIINSAEFGGAFVESDLKSTAVPPLKGSRVLALQYSTTRTPNGGGVLAGFASATFDFNALDLTAFDAVLFSIDTSRFPNFASLGVQFEDRDNRVLVRTNSSSASLVGTTGNWKTYRIPLAAFAGVNMTRVTAISFSNPWNATDNPIAGTLYVDDIRFTRSSQCNAASSVEFDSTNYNPATSVGAVYVSDPCAANSLALVKVENDSDAIYVGVELDAAGNGQGIFNLARSNSVCESSDSAGILRLSGQLMATYTRAKSARGGSSSAFAAAGIDAAAATSSLSGERAFFYATDPTQSLAFLPDVDFNYSIFGSGSVLNGAFADSTFNPVFRVTSGDGYFAEVAQIALINIGAGFAENAESINFKFKNQGSPNNAVKIELGILGGAADAVVVDLADTAVSTLIGDGWYQVSVPLSDFPNAASADFIAFTSADPAPAAGAANRFSFLITDIFLRESIGNLPEECEQVVQPPVTGSGTGATGATGGPFSVSFDDMAVSYSFVGFGNPDTVNGLAADPVDAGNLVATTTKLAGAQVWAGVTVETTPGITWPVSAAESEITIRIYSPGPGLVVRMKLEESVNAGNFVETDAVTTVTTGWETLTFDFNNPVGAPLNPAFTYDKLSLFFGFGTPGDGTTYTWDTIEFQGIGGGPGGELLINGDFETGDITGWDFVPNDGTFSATMEQSTGTGVWSGNLVASVPAAGGPASFPLATQVGLAKGAVTPGQTVTVAFDLCGAVEGLGGVFSSALLSEIDGGGASATNPLFGNIPLTETWTQYSMTTAAGPDVSGGITLQLKSDCGGNPGCTVNAYVDNVSVTLDGEVGNVSGAGGACPIDTGGGGGGADVPVPFTTVVYDEAYADVWGTFVCCGGATVTEEAADDVTRGNVVQIDYTAGGTIAGLQYGAAELLDVSKYATGGGTLEFDALVTRAGMGEWKIKIEGAGGGDFIEVPLSASTEGLAPVEGVWQHYTFDIENDLSGGSMTWDRLNLILFFSDFGNGLGAIQIDNLVFKEAGLVISENGFDDIWEGFDCCGGAAVTQETATDTAFGEVIQVDYFGGGTIAGLKYGPGGELLDASAFATDGTLEFDALVTRAGTGDWKIKIEGATGADFVEVPFTASNEGVAPVEGVWQHYSFDIAAALSGGSLNWGEVKLLLFFSDFGSGLGQIQVDNVGFRAGGSGGGGGGGGPNLAVNGDFETGDFTGTQQFLNGGSQSITTVNPSAGTYAANLNVVTTQSDTVLKFANLDPGGFTEGQTIYIKFDMRGTLDPGGVGFAEFFSEVDPAGVSKAEILFGNAPIFPDANPDVWTTFSTTATTGPDTSGGVTLQLKASTGGGSLADLYFDNVCVSTAPCP